MQSPAPEGKPAPQAKLTLDLVKRWVRYSLKQQNYGYEVEIKSIRWLGKLRREPGNRSIVFRRAEVILEDERRKRFRKIAEVDNTGGFDIR